MNIDDLTLGQIKQLKSMIGGECADDCGGEVRMVVLQRGWVVVGRYFRKGSQCQIKNGYVIRRWGTSEGLGELALKGPQSETKLESTPLVEFHELTAVFTARAVEEKWAMLCPGV